jgi:hypothetical protein
MKTFSSWLSKRFSEQTYGVQPPTPQRGYNQSGNNTNVDIQDRDIQRFSIEELANKFSADKTKLDLVLKKKIELSGGLDNLFRKNVYNIYKIASLQADGHISSYITPQKATELLKREDLDRHTKKYLTTIEQKDAVKNALNNRYRL